MGIDRDTALALRIPPVTAQIERGRLRFFADATGQTDPVYSDVTAALEAGHTDLPVPPTFLFGLELEAADPFGYLRDLGVDLRQVLHGEQRFSYDTVLHAGDTVTLQPRITDVATRKNGALQILVKETTVLRDGEPVAQMQTVVLVREPKAGACS